MKYNNTEETLRSSVSRFQSGEASLANQINLSQLFCFVERTRVVYACPRKKYTLAGYCAEVESRTQGSRPRPRTQKKSEAKAKDSLSEDRHSRGQGQGPRTQAQVLSK